MSKEYSKEELKTELLTRYPLLRDCIGKIEEMLCMMERTYRSGGKILLCGNGGSCADCDHIVGELMKGFLLKRPVTDDKAEMFGKICPDKADFLAENLQIGIPAISLPSQSAVISAFANDVKPELVFAQLVFGYGGKFRKCRICRDCREGDGVENRGADRRKREQTFPDMRLLYYGAGDRDL